MEYQSEEDRDFIVDDGYKHDEDPAYFPEKEESSDDFEKLRKKARKLGAESLDYSKRKNKKYVVMLPGGKNLHFGSSQYPDFLIRKDKERKEKYLARAKKIKNKKGELTYENPESANFWSVNLLWSGK